MERTGVANLTVRGAYRVLVEEGLVESIPKRGFYVRRRERDDLADEPLAARARPGRRCWTGGTLTCWRPGWSPCRRSASRSRTPGCWWQGQPAGERLGLAAGSRVLVRRAIRSRAADGGRCRAAGRGTPRRSSTTRTTWSARRPLASPAPASAFEVLAGIGHRLRGHHDELRPRVATAEERRLLALPQVSVVLELARTAHSADGKPVVVLHQVRRGDGATYTYDITYPGR